jgi:hypothetical protein
VRVICLKVNFVFGPSKIPKYQPVQTAGIQSSVSRSTPPVFFCASCWMAMLPRLTSVIKCFHFMVSLTTLLEAHCIAANGRMIYTACNELEMICQVVAKCVVLAWHLLWWLRKSTAFFYLGSWSPDRYLNQGPPEYESRTLTSWPLPSIVGNNNYVVLITWTASKSLETMAQFEYTYLGARVQISVACIHE